MRKQNNIKGWTSEKELDFLYTVACDMNSIAELGCYLGRSTVVLLAGCKGIVTVIDNWKGSEGLVMEGTEREDFLKNVKGFKNIELIDKDTVDAAKDIGMVDMVFIDADHSYEAVKKDVETWLPKTRKLICGHDYDIAEVKKAVDWIELDGVVGSIWYKYLNK